MFLGQGSLREFEENYKNEYAHGPTGTFLYQFSGVPDSWLPIYGPLCKDPYAIQSLHVETLCQI